MSSKPPLSHEVTVRVRYCETDAMGYLHHANHVNYFEMGRTELLRALGGNYREMEETGLFLVIVRIECDYKTPAKYDDLLTVRTAVGNQTSATIEFDHSVLREGQLLSSGKTVLSCVDAKGRVQRIKNVLPELHGERETGS